jgi:hypothetical protein
MATRQNLQHIVDEIRVLRGKIDRLEDIIEKRLVGEVKPDSYERKAISEFEKKKKSGKAKFVPLSEIAG